MNLVAVEKEEIGIQMSPLIDVVFLLIIFFLLTTTFRVEKELTSPLPGAAKQSEVTKQIPREIVIGIEANGRVFVKGKTYDSPTSKEMPELRAMLTECKTFFKDPIVIILPEKAAKYKRVINVLDACAAANIKKISFASAAIRAK